MLSVLKLHWILKLVEVYKMLKITKGNVKPVFYEMRKKYDGNFDNMYADDKDALK